MKQKTGGNFSVYLDNSRAVNLRAAAYRFDHPVDLIIADRQQEILPSFERLRHYLAEGYYAAGWISYEVGLSFEDRLIMPPQAPPGMPFISLGIYKNRTVVNSADNEAYWNEKLDRGNYSLGEMRLNISPEDYQAAMVKIAEYLRAGDIYQVDFTLKSLFDFTGSAESCYAAMRQAQRVEYGAFITSDHLSVLSLSPELFFSKTGRIITTRPMKGTCPRGRSNEEDQQQAEFLKYDEKNRAENLMIVDLLRNDMAKISSAGSVRVTSLYEVEKYRTLLQMTSTIMSEARDNLDIIDLITALFPCGSVIGAPKIRAMEIIAELEKSSRGIYTGAIGYITPANDCCFSVPIRTITIDHEGKGQMGIGSGVVADSDATAEYEECLLKAEFATGDIRDFDLIETLRWSEDEGFYLLDLHMARLAASARYFDYRLEQNQVTDCLHGHAAFLAPDRCWKIRLLLSRTGEISLISCPIEDNHQNDKLLITLSDKAINSRNAMIFHKTTDRALYLRELKYHKDKYGSYDVVFLNENGNLTEGSFNNIFLKRGEYLYTPSLDSGVLNGTLRQSLLRDPTVKLIEKYLTPADVQAADRIYMGNSVRGLREVTFRAL